MKRAKGIIPQISEEEPTVEEFITLDTFSPHAKLRPGELRDILNMDIYGQYLKTRNGSEALSSFNAPSYDIISSVTIDTGDNEYVIAQMALTASLSTFFYLLLDGSFGWTPIYLKDTSTPYTVSGIEPADMMVSNGKVYVFMEDGNKIFEYKRPRGFDTATWL